MSDKPGTPGNVTARAYARSTDFKALVGDEIYKRMGFDLYDDAKTTSAPQHMIAPLELVYDQITPKNPDIEPYNIVVGLGELHTEIRGNGYANENVLRNEEITIIKFDKRNLKNIYGIDSDKAEVAIHPEDVRFMKLAGYNIDFGKPQVEFDGQMVVLLTNSGLRRIAGIQDKWDGSWHEVERKR